MATPLAQLVPRLAAAGMDVCGITSVEAHLALQPRDAAAFAGVPGARSVWVFGSSRALWDALLADLRAHPQHLAGEAHPLDAYVRRTLTALDPAPVARTWFFADVHGPTHLDFRSLGLAAGLGRRSKLGLLLNDSLGPWMGLRAACVSVEEGVPTGPLEGDPCAGCAAPCISACPGGAFPAGTWDVAACAAFHVASPRCATSCDARAACPVGTAARYSPEEVHYHSDPRSGRAHLRAAAGLAAESDPTPSELASWPKWTEPSAR